MTHENGLEESISINQVNYNKAHGIAEEVFYNFKTVASFFNFKFELERFKAKIETAYNSGLKRTQKLSVIVALLNLFIFLGSSLGVLSSTYLMHSKDKSNFSETEIKPGDIYIVLSVILMSAVAVEEEMPNFKALMESSYSAYNFFQLRSSTLSKQSKAALEPNKKPALIESKIEFKNVSFAYANNPEKKVLNKLSFTLKPNTLNAFVGTSGSGKTTIISLLQRFYKTQTGKIKIGDHDIYGLEIDFLRSLIGFVPQEPILFNKSIKENILIGREGISEAQLQKACEMAHLTNFISNLEKGLETVVGVKGSKISGGEKQRIAIARAIVANPKILIFDEATSALDNKSEKKVQLAIDSISKQMTTIIIAHRLSTIIKADKIFVMKDGRIIESGTHKRLMRNQAYYAKLIRHQLNKTEGQSKNENENASRQQEEFKETVNNEFSSPGLSLIEDSFSSASNAEKDVTDESSFSIELVNESTDELRRLIKLSEKVDVDCEQYEKNVNVGYRNQSNYQSNYSAKNQKSKKSIYEIVYENKNIFNLTIFSSVFLAVFFSLGGFLEASFSDGLVVTPTEKLIAFGWKFALIYLVFGAIFSFAYYLQK